MTPEEIRAKVNDVQALTLTLFGEVRHEPLEGILAVAAVVKNRTLQQQRFAPDYRGVCLAKSQFSCWWPFGGKSNFDTIMAIADIWLTKDIFTENFPQRRAFFQCKYIAEGVVTGKLYNRSVVGASTHYYAPEAMIPRGRVPEWAKNRVPTATIGGHIFFEGIA